jgi:hypothetical protein
MYTTDRIVPTKWEKDWLVTADLRGLETFDNCESNYDIVDLLKANKVLNKRTREDSEYCQFFAYFSTKTAAESFIRRLSKYVEKRKAILASL